VHICLAENNDLKITLPFKISKIYVFLFCVLGVVLVALTGIYIFTVSNYKEFTENSRVAENQVHQTIFGKRVYDVFDAVRKDLLRMEELLLCCIDGSDIDKINSAAGYKWIKVDKDTIEILDKVMDVSKNTAGIFDITTLPLRRLWGLDDFNHTTVPEAQQIDRLLSHVDYTAIQIEHHTQRVQLTDKCASISLRSLLRGVLCGKAVDIYRRSPNIEYGIVSVNGVVGVYGEKPDHTRWKISIKDPFDSDSIIAILKMKGGYAATFGGYADKISLNGEKVNKIVNPITGYLPDTEIASVTVIYPDPIIACALAETCSIANKSDRYRILNHYGAEAIFIDFAGRIYLTANIFDDFNLTKEEHELERFSINKADIDKTRYF
jgi:thiamine biosynthesis lipoprotein